MRLLVAVALVLLVACSSGKSRDVPDENDTTTTSVVTAGAAPTAAPVTSTTTTTIVLASTTTSPLSVPHDEDLCLQDPDEIAASEPPHGPPCD